jgi:protein-disulfide isomerase
MTTKREQIMRMTYTRAFCAALALAAGAAACQPAAPSGLPSEAELQVMTQRIEQYFRKTANLPDQVTVKLVDVAAVQSTPLLSGTLELSSGSQLQKVPLVMSRDGHYLVAGQLIDLTVDPMTAIMQKISLKDEPMRGNANAAVTIVEYSDFQCPFCAQAYKTVEEEVLKEYGDKVRLVFKNFPLNIHPWAESAALATACVRQQKPEAFWKLYDFFFVHQAEITPANVKEQALGVVRDAGADAETFTACFDSKSAMGLVKADEDEATALAVRSTPTFFINGRRLEGAVPLESFKPLIEEALATRAGGAGAGGVPAPTAGVQPG